MIYSCNINCGAAPINDSNKCNIHISLSCLYTQFLSFTNRLLLNEYIVEQSKIKYLEIKLLTPSENKNTIDWLVDRNKLGIIPV